ncbi:metalloregulator ArsR/SmtB family transcription factor [Paenibacillus sp. PL2-23]|uniref:ArsR/SmtB family transcription factor n=1 Tax=Paenibacillus sp. PL2-23 TaxID=2100729 RepID=UPI0030F58BFF
MDHTMLTTKVKFIRGFGDKTRLQILDSIKQEEKSVTQLMAEVEASQSSISQHLGCLKECGLIVGRQEGKFMYYSLSSDRIKLLLDMMDEVFMEVQTGVECCDQHFETCEG